MLFVYLFFFPSSGNEGVETMHALRYLDHHLLFVAGINLVNWWAQGVGEDLYWPPNQERNFSLESLVPGSMDYCAFLADSGLYGVPESMDEWSVWDDAVYGGVRLKYSTNIGSFIILPS